MISGPVEVVIVFTLPKPVTVPKNRNGYPSVPPDIDKLLRSTFDGLKTAGVIEDDSRVVSVTAYKRYQSGKNDKTGALISIRKATGENA
jgi:Holliday junction resolvase RusA-like endonuclease